MIKIVLFCLAFFTTYFGISQVGINTLSPNALLEIRASSLRDPANTDGILIPVVEAFPLTNPGRAQDGMIIFVNGNGAAARGLHYWDNDNTSWVIFSDEIWRLGGNVGTDGGIADFIGTVDNQPLVFKVNNVNQLRLTASGQIETLNTNQSVFLGEGAAPTSSGMGNIVLGYNSGNALTTGSLNTLVGLEAGAGLTTQANNTFIGSYSGFSVTTGGLNTFLGSGAGGVTTTGSDNTMIGVSTGQRNNTGNANVMIGRAAGLFNYAADNNIYIGSYAGEGSFDASEALTYSNNVFIGNRSGQNVAGSNNVFIGNQSGRNESGSNRLYIENSNTTTPLIGGDFSNNRVGINRPIGSLSNTLEVGGTASKAAAGAWMANSDRRLKTDVQTIDGNAALALLMELRGVTYQWADDKTGIPRPEGLQYGFIAQEIMRVFPDKVTKDKMGYYQTAYGDYDPIMVAAIARLNQKIEEKNSRIESLERRLEKLEALLIQDKYRVENTTQNSLKD